MALDNLNALPTVNEVTTIIDGEFDDLMDTHGIYRGLAKNDGQYYIDGYDFYEYLTYTLIGEYAIGDEDPNATEYIHRTSIISLHFTFELTTDTQDQDTYLGSWHIPGRISDYWFNATSTNVKIPIDCKVMTQYGNTKYYEYYKGTDSILRYFLFNIDDYNFGLNFYLEIPYNSVHPDKFEIWAQFFL